MASPSPANTPSAPPPADAGARATRAADRRLRLEDILKLMVAEGLVTAADADRLARSRTHRFEHPLEMIADQKWRSLLPPRSLMTLEWLVEWLAGKLGVPYHHVDPLKIDLVAVTSTMSNAYAERYRILPVAVRNGELTVATSEPFVRAWAEELEKILHLKIRLVFANPVLLAMTSRIKLLARMEIVEKRRPQDGRIKTVSPEGQEIELRISTMPTAFGEKIVMRIFTPEVLIRDFQELGFTAEDYTRWDKMIREPNGIVLVTGPTGSGKTTTLYSTMKQLATPEVNVCSVEDPIEMIAPEFNQMQVQPTLNVDFASGVRTLLRQDPDIIMVGEIRDRDTADMAVQAALTGHLVLSSLHTNDAPSAVTRLLDLGVPPYLITSTLLGVMAQRLVRTLCPHCKKLGDAPDEEAWRMLTAPFRADLPAQVQTPVGCLECRMTGYYGRVGLYEIMMLSPTLRRLIHAESEDAKIREQAYREGMKPLRVSGASKIAAGVSTLDEVMKVAPLA